jgi:enamine deaminase RidA (YjgF/YER057c/UK114 family)
MHTILQPAGWKKPLGYANGILAKGRSVHIGGQIGWNGQCEWESDDFVAQTRQTLQNVVDILAEAGGRPEHIVSMTWYFISRDEYLARPKELGAAYRAVIGRHFPAMAAVQVAALVEARAKIEIQAVAVIPD